MYPQADGEMSTAAGMPLVSSMDANARAGQARPVGGISCAYSTASDQVASSDRGQPSMAAGAVVRSRCASSARYSRQVPSATMITLAASAIASGSPSMSSARSSASIRWSGKLTSRVLR